MVVLALMSVTENVQYRHSLPSLVTGLITSLVRPVWSKLWNWCPSPAQDLMWFLDESSCSMNAQLTYEKPPKLCAAISFFLGIIKGKCEPGRSIVRKTPETLQPDRLPTVYLWKLQTLNHCSSDSPFFSKIRAHYKVSHRALLLDHFSGREINVIFKWRDQTVLWCFHGFLTVIWALMLHEESFRKCWPQI